MKEYIERTKRTDPSLPSRKFVELISNKKLSRATASKMFQLRTGHIPLNAYLHRFKRKASANCPACGAERETPQHFLLECPAYAYERGKLKARRGSKEKKIAELLSKEDGMAALAGYIQATDRFKQEDPNPPNSQNPQPQS